MLKNNQKFLASALFVLALCFASSEDYFSYTLPSPVQPILNNIESKNDYKGLIKLQEAFVRNAKTIKPAVVSINKVKEVIENSSWDQIDPKYAPRPPF